ncbi:MAG: DNA methylase [bacterium]
MKTKISAKELGIDLISKEETEIFKWFLACLLFGKPIQQTVAERAYFEFVKEGLVSPDKIIAAGWDKLVEVLDRGHYVRFDFSTATKLLEICGELKQKYGTMSNLIENAKDKKDLKEKLIKFKGIGPVTARIFLSELK